jgi:hypothetical protein
MGPIRTRLRRKGKRTNALRTSEWLEGGLEQERGRNYRKGAWRGRQIRGGKLPLEKLLGNRSTIDIKGPNGSVYS